MAFTHGTPSGYVSGCTCDSCRLANNDKASELRQQRADSRELIDGRLVAVNAPKHGVPSTYTNWVCRCIPCTTANSENHARWRQGRTKVSHDRDTRLTEIQRQVDRYFIAAHGADYRYRAPETFTNLMERWLLLVFFDVTLGNEVMMQIEQIAREHRQSRSSDE